MFEIQTYRSPNGQDPCAQWLAALVDRQARARVLIRVNRMVAGNFGDCMTGNSEGNRRDRKQTTFKPRAR